MTTDSTWPACQGPGFDVGVATVYRYIREALAVLAPDTHPGNTGVPGGAAVRDPGRRPDSDPPRRRRSTVLLRETQAPWRERADLGRLPGAAVVSLAGTARCRSQADRSPLTWRDHRAGQVRGVACYARCCLPRCRPRSCGVVRRGIRKLSRNHWNISTHEIGRLTEGSPMRRVCRAEPRRGSPRGRRFAGKWPAPAEGGWQRSRRPPA